jgi:archaetidylinositol phosphate synthase
LAARGFWRIGFSPNAVTVLGFIVIALGAWLVLLGAYPFAILCVVLGGFLDGVDGSLARMLNKVTLFGGALDSILDRYGDALLIVSIWYSFKVNPIAGSLALVGSFVTSYARARLENTGLSLSNVGILERPERIIILVLTIIFNVVANYFFIALAILSNITVIQRVLYGRKNLGDK